MVEMSLLMGLFILAILIGILAVRAKMLETYANQEDIPDPRELFSRARKLLDKYDRPDVMSHVAFVMDKDPGQLARAYMNGLK